MDKPPRSLNLEDFDEEYLGKNLYKLTLKTPFYVAGTGAAVTKTYKFPFAHRLTKVEVKHCDASDVDSSAALTWSLSKQIAKSLFEKIISEDASTITDFIDVLGEGYEFSSMLYKFITNTTLNHRIYLIMTIQLTKPLPTAEELEELEKHGRKS